MTLTKLPIRPGIFKDEPPLSVETYFSDGDNVRFYRGKAEPIGGWRKLSDTKLEGKVRGLNTWASNDGATYLAAGSHVRLYAMVSEVVSNITPFREEGTLTGPGPFSTTAGSRTVKVADLSHGLSVGDIVVFGNSTAVGGITVSGEYRVSAITDASNYEIEHPTPATSTATGGGTVDYFYELPIGQEFGALYFGFGVGGWGLGTWGTARESGVVLSPRTWVLDNWGQNLLANPRGGGLYEWNLSPNERAFRVPNAPEKVNSFFVTPERHIVALGTNSEIDGIYDPLLIRWCSQSDNTDWTTMATNTAGEFRLASGSLIVAGTNSRLQNLIWTDISLHSMTYRGDIEFVFSFDQLGTDCGLAGPHAFAEKDGLAFWMSPTGQFYVYDGSPPKALDCPVRRYVYSKIVRRQYDAIWCGINSQYSEVWWWYASGGDGTEIDRFVGYCYADGTWFLGSVPRTSWVDKSNFEGPIGAGADGYLYVHEQGVDADGAALRSHAELAPFDLGDGEQVMNLHRIVPDMDLTGRVTFEVRTKRFPAGNDQKVISRNYTEGMDNLAFRAQGRQASLKISCEDVGATFRLGDLRVDASIAGFR